AELLQIAEIFLLTSKSEGIPLTILEAFASGVPVAATNVGGIPEVIESGKNGLLAPSGDSGKIAEHLNRLLTEPEFASSISQNAQERFFREFTETKMVGEYEKIFLRLLGK
ncbi:MAG: glycosyltransferase family 4 protein, partial [Thermoguttaceae bacterium]|nr:glycosyltransferase family 4 protein [Thermoguttaceae bacterium]